VNFLLHNGMTEKMGQGDLYGLLATYNYGSKTIRIVGAKVMGKQLQLLMNHSLR
jgi:hypothetical protein